ncbi:ubiquitin carboxyl-terminal hydrolase 47-like [Notolabrus celidotus]|uniref:ubiquitin carboxyl-terminal hydrolase 47-like n=1 Tax=Notolabrus celidotus TaxID=1203425 RepID=UPI00148FD731|nr:ubiquitin carboxyl-terminal hydrolase 47-like [Notolabrus celidotus]XP_034532866.1 ubiquitin carboxyl-terminal hydrolase 47-like [Notolabrus celidotus]XP_034532867.1 ubiquitin carboxyl-terminal hydrolase 47-like [Notolabrus celidotus]XP_034532868.1 ubiquitin carboxyl-terminal hydrolase 47-like [Notolabrus celidotus]
MSHDLVKLFRKKLYSLNIADHHGLKSPGLTCYLNCILQVLFMTEDFREAVKRCSSEDSTAIDSHLADLFSALEKKMSRTHGIIRKLGIGNVYEQRDAAEYFEKILCRTSPEASQMFKGQLNHRTKCLKCAETNNTRGSFWFLPLAVEDPCRQIFSVEKGLETFFKGEKVCGENKIFCNRCNKKQDEEFGCDIAQSPEVLTLLLKRFSFDDKCGRYIKLHCKVEVPKTLQIADCTYDLYALVDHFGDLTGGHYTALIKSFETQGWYRFNDDIVSGVRHAVFGAEDECLRSRTAYLLMYRKVSKHREKCDDGASDALCPNSDVDAEREEVPGLHHQLKDECIAEEENFKRLNGRQKQTNFSEGLENPFHQRAPHEEMIPRDGGQQTPELNRRRLDMNSVDPILHLSIRGTPSAHLTTHFQNCLLENKHETKTRRLRGTNTDCETQEFTAARTEITAPRMTDVNRTRSRVQPAETEVVKNKTEVDISQITSTTDTASKGERRPRAASKSRDRVTREPWRC